MENVIVEGWLIFLAYYFSIRIKAYCLWLFHCLKNNIYHIFIFQNWAKPWAYSLVSISCTNFPHSLGWKPGQKMTWVVQSP